MSKGGRPTEGEKVKLAPLNMRTSPDLRAQIEQAADASGRSLTQEVERRLRTSFIFDQHYHSAHIAAFVSMLTGTIQTIEVQKGAKFTADIETWEAVKAAAERLLRWNRPALVHEDAWPEIVSSMGAAEDEFKAATSALDDFRKGVGIVSINGIEFPWATTTKPRRGLFGSTTGASLFDPRSGMTDEQRETEASLLDRLATATIARDRCSDRVMAVIRPQQEALQNARQFGDAEAEKMFSQIGPKAGV